MPAEVAEITCLSCGRNLGSVQRKDGHTRLLPAPDRPSAAPVAQTRRGGLVCGRCGGFALFGPWERVMSYAA